MKKQQLIAAGAGLVLLVFIFIFGKTIPPVKAGEAVAAANTGGKQLDINAILTVSKSKLNASQLSYINRLEHSVVRGDVKNQQIESCRQLAAFWKDSVQNAFLPSVYYMAEAAKLENSEKSLTFAAQLFLNNLRAQDNPALRNWMAGESRDLFKRALLINPGNDSLTVGLGATYIFGSGADDPQNVMKGIQQILEVTRKDSTNMYAQFMLGLGGIESGQIDKAVARLSRVVSKEPHNLEAVLNLAEAYERLNDKASAITWYRKAKALSANPELTKAIEQRLAALQ